MTPLPTLHPVLPPSPAPSSASPSSHVPAHCLLPHKALQNCQLLLCPNSRAGLNAALPGGGGGETLPTSSWDCSGPSVVGPSLHSHLLPSYPTWKARLHGLHFEVFLLAHPEVLSLPLNTLEPAGASLEGLSHSVSHLFLDLSNHP